MASPGASHPLAHVMQVNGWSHRDLARVISVEAQADEINMSAPKGKVWKWMHGVTPDRVTQLLLARRLGIDAAEVDRRPWPLWLPAYDGIRTDQPNDHRDVLDVLAELGGDVHIDRRSFMLLTGQKLISFAASDFAIPGATLTGAAGTQVDAELVTDIEAGIPRLRRIEARLGGAAVRDLVNAELHTVISLLREAQYTSNEGRQLYRIVAELARVAGWAMFDGQFHASAQRYWSIGLYAARSAGDRLVAANILKSMSLQCLDFGQSGDALDIAETTSSGLRSASPRIKAMFGLRKARALAAAQDRAGCLRLLAATDADAASPHDGDPDWIGYFDQAEYSAQVGSCYLDLGDLHQADVWFGQALDLMPATKGRDKATYLLRRAEVHTALGDLSRAADYAGAAIPVMRNAPSARNDSRLHRVRDTLHRRGTAVEPLELP